MSNSQAGGKVIITAAVTGAIHTPTMSPHLPITPDQIAADAIDAAEAGAAILHLHARDPETGKPDQTPEAFARFLPRIKQATNAAINITTGGSPYMKVEERVKPAAKFKPEVASLNMGSINFGLFQLADKYKNFKFDWEKPHLEATRDLVFRNTFKDIEYILETCYDNGTRFEFECYDIAHLYNLAHFADRGLVKPPFFVQSVFGILGGIGAHPEDVMHMKRTADRLFGDQFRWSVLGAGASQIRIAAQAAALGGNIRVGLEDALGRPAASWPSRTPSRCGSRARSSRASAWRSPPPTRRARSCRSRAATRSPSDSLVSCLLSPVSCFLPSAFCLLPSAFCLLPSALLAVSVNRPASVDHQHVPDDHVGQMARQEQHRADQILRLVPASRRQHLRGRPLLVAGPLEDHLSRLGFGNARRHHVDGDALLRPLERQRPREVVHACLRGRVDGASLEGHDAEVRPDVDNLAAALRNHHARGCLAGEEHALQRRRHGACRTLPRSRRAPASCRSSRRCSPGYRRVRTSPWPRRPSAHLVDLRHIGEDESIAFRPSASISACTSLISS